jgi:hypothetical protein
MIAVCPPILLMPGSEQEREDSEDSSEDEDREE